MLKSKWYTVLSGRKERAEENAKRRLITCHDTEVCFVWGAQSCGAPSYAISAVVNYVVGLTQEFRTGFCIGLLSEFANPLFGPLPKYHRLSSSNC